MRRIKTGIIGTGFIGATHIETLRRLGYVDIVALAEADQELADQKAKEFHIPKAYGNYKDLIKDPEIEVIHNCTPNNMHLKVNTETIKANKHIFSEKPLAMDSQQSLQMLNLLEEHKIVHGVNFNYRMYPLAQEMKQKIKDGEIGDIRLVHGSYLQDWLLYDTDYNWRIEPEIAGKTRAIGDIGSHWCDLAQTVTGLKIEEVYADLSTIIPIRKKFKTVETFSVNKELTDYEEKQVRTEDWAAVLIKFNNGARGVFYVSEVSAGRKCYFNIEINGSQSTFYWNQEKGDRMWVGYRDQPNREVMRDPNQMTQDSKKYAFLPGGHPEGWNDAFKNNLSAFYTFILQGKDIAKDPTDFATFREGHDIMVITDAIAESNRKKQWVKINR